MKRGSRNYRNEHIECLACVNPTDVSTGGRASSGEFSRYTCDECRQHLRDPNDLHVAAWFSTAHYAQSRPYFFHAACWTDVVYPWLQADSLRRKLLNGRTEEVSV